MIDMSLREFSPRRALALIVLGCAIAATPAVAQTVVTLGGGFHFPSSVAVDSLGNVFVADTGNSAVKEILAGNGTTNSLVSGFFDPQGVAVDGSGNVFVADTANYALKEILAAGGYATVETLGGYTSPNAVAVDGSGNIFLAQASSNAVTEIRATDGHVIPLGSGFHFPKGVAVDRNGNVFVADQDNNAVKEILAAGGYVTVNTLGTANSTCTGSTFCEPGGVAVDSAGNVYVAETGNSAVREILAAGGYTTVKTLALNFNFNGPNGVAVDAFGNVFVADTGNDAVEEILAPVVLAAAVLPDSRSVELGNPATIFATIINPGSAALDNCRIALPATAPSGLTLNYQTTNPATNALTGTPNSPVAISGNNGSQSFVLSFQATAPFTAPGLALSFLCDLSPPAPSVLGVNTVDLAMSATPVADIIALSATSTGNGIVEVPNGAAAAFAVASTNVGVTAPITVSVDTGAASLPVAALICQSNPSTGQCLASPAASVSLSYAGGTTPTFSIFLQANGPIAFSPATARVVVRFEDSGGGLHGSTSVAIETL
jgi:sugar lactone lactonase YvrE